MTFPRLPTILTALACLLGLRPPQCAAQLHPAQTWTQLAPATQNNELRDLVEGNGVYLALTDDPAGAVLRSVDGIQFGREPLGVPGTGPNEALHWHDGEWLAVRDGTLYHKAPADPAWQPVPGAPARIVGLATVDSELWAWTFGGFDHPNGMAVRVFPHLWCKAPALSWTEATVTAPATPAVDYSGLIRENGRYVLTGNGYDFDLQLFTGGVWTSDDGVNWVTSAYGDYRRMAWNGARFVGGSTSGRITLSDDGISWFRVDFPFIDGLIVGSGGTFPIFSPAWSIAWLGDAFWVVTSTFGKPILAKSVDGVDWIEVTAGQAETERAPLRALRVLGGMPYFLGAQGYLWRAADWETAREALLPVEPWNWRGVAANATTLLAVGEGGHTARSTDANTLVPGTIAGAATAEAVVWLQSAQTFVAIGRSADAEVHAWRSPDGVVWDEAPIGAWPAGDLGLAAGPDGAMICGPGGRLAFSNDGSNWLPIPSGTTADLWQIAYGGGRWVAAGPSGEVIHSLDRTNWQSTTRPVLSHFVWNEGTWYFANPVNEASITVDFLEWSPVSPSTLPAASALVSAFGEIFGDEGRFLTSSTDGLTWLFRSEINLATIPTRCLTAGVRFLDRLIYVGRDGRIHRSDPWRYYQDWRQTHFSPGQQNNDAISGPLADPDSDGAPNAVEYACGLNPLLPDARAAITFDYSARTFRYPRSTAASGVNLWAETSADLLEWTRTGLDVAQTTDDFSPVLYQVYATLIDQAAPQAFFRLRATIPPASP